MFFFLLVNLSQQIVDAARLALLSGPRFLKRLQSEVAAVVSEQDLTDALERRRTVFLQVVPGARIEPEFRRIQQCRQDDFVAVGGFGVLAEPAVEDPEITIDQHKEPGVLLQAI